MTDDHNDKQEGLIDRIKDALGIGLDAERNPTDATIQPSSNDTPPSSDGIDAAPHMGDDDSLMPVGEDESGPIVTPSTAGDDLDQPLGPPDDPEAPRPGDAPDPVEPIDER